MKPVPHCVRCQYDCWNRNRASTTQNRGGASTTRDRSCRYVQERDVENLEETPVPAASRNSLTKKHRCQRRGQIHGSPTPALRATPPRMGIRHSTSLSSVHYALWAWKRFKRCQFRLRRARSLSRSVLLRRV